ncbi:MAG: bacteriohopanetetrol glucosamine biosynthesis glycosyltransferase HpnI [Terriglobia bacterium]
MWIYFSILFRQSSLLGALRDAILFAPFLAYAYYLVAAACSARFFARREPQDCAPPASILKPVRGVDREAYENFASFCRLDYPEYEMLFGVADPADPVVPIIERLIRDYPARSIRLFTGAANHGPNQKASILAHLAREARHDLLVISDSDTRPAAGWLRAIAAPFRDPRVGAASCLFRGEDARTWADKLEALTVSTDFMSAVLVAERFGGAKFALGATMAARRAALDETGGFENLSQYLLDDYEMGRRIAARGYSVRLLSHTVGMVLPAQTFAAYWRRQLRWLVGIRNSRPWGHFGLLITQGLPLTLLAVAAARSASLAAFYISAYLVARYTMAWATGIMGLQDSIFKGNAWLLPVRDAIAFASWVASLVYRRVHWRGDAYSIRKGRLVPE